MIATKIKAGFGVAFAIFLGAGIAAVFQTFVWEGSAGWVSHSWDVIARLDETALRAKDAEEAARRLSRVFATNDLTRCRGDLLRVTQLASELRQLTSDDLSQHKNAALLESVAADQAATFNAGLSTASAAGVMLMLVQYDRESIGLQFEKTVNRMRDEERALLAVRVGRQRDVALFMRQLSEVASALAFFLMLLAAWRASVELRQRNAAERALLAREEQYRQVVESAGDIIYRTDHLGRFTFCNQASMNTLHLTEREVRGRSYLKLIRQDKRLEAERFYLRQFARRQKSSYFEFPIIDGHGQERWIGQNVQLLIEGDKVAGFQAIAREITERKHAEHELEKSRVFVEKIAATTPGILYVYDLNQRRNVYSNREVVSVLGYKPEEMQRHSDLAEQFFHADDLPAIRAHHEQLRSAHDGEVRRIDYRARHAAGHWVWLSSRDTPFERGPDGVVRQIVGIAQDVTAHRTAQEQLAWRANFDALTGLSNRHHFMTRLQSTLRRAAMEHTTTSVCILDIDHFKDINDRFGHSAGDQVLEALGSVIRGELRPRDTAGRLGGDEFVILLPATNQRESAALADRIREQLGAISFGLASENAFSVTATFGVAEWLPWMKPKDFVEAADRALYRAKSSGRNRVFVEV